MDQNDELQAAINNITNGDNSSADNDVVSQIANKVANDNAAGANAGAPAMPDLSALNSSMSGLGDKTNGAGSSSNAQFGASAMGAANNNVNASDASADFAVPSFSNMNNGASKNDSKIEITPQKAMYGDPDLDRVKSNALNEIRPILETVDIPFEKKFMIYKDIIELTDDKACIEPAYNAARQIVDEKTRAESLLYIIEIIDSLGIKQANK